VNPEIHGHVRDPPAGLDHIQHVTAELGRITPSPHVVLLEDNSTRVQNPDSTQRGTGHTQLGVCEQLGTRHDPAVRSSADLRHVRESASASACLVRGSGPEIRQDGEHPPVRVGRFVDAELEEDVSDVGFDGAFGDEHPAGDRAVGQALGEE
jgi:hypothetical protein